MKFDEDLAAIHAYLCADGYVIKNPEKQKQKYYMVGFRNNDPTLLKDFQKRFEKVFNKKPYIVKEGRCRIGSKEIYKKLTKQFGSFYSWKWKIPKLNNKLIAIWLKAYFDCEGWVICKRHQNRLIGADCVNEFGIKQVKDALDKLSIDSKIKKRRDRNIFSIKIYGKENLIKFNEKIGFLHPLKKERLKEVVNDFIDYYWKFPKEKKKLKNFIRNLLLEKAKVKKDNGIIRITSNKEKNLLVLRSFLKNVFDIEARLNKFINGVGTIYFQLNINKQEQIKKMIDNNLINEEERKWLSLKK
jgi:hypothetical protein